MTEYVTRRQAHRAGFWEGILFGALIGGGTVALYCWYWY